MSDPGYGCLRRAMIGLAALEAALALAWIALNLDVVGTRYQRFHFEGGFFFLVVPLLAAAAITKLGTPDEGVRGGGYCLLWPLLAINLLVFFGYVASSSGGV